MIDLLFYFGTEIIFVRIEGTMVTFGNSGFGAKMAVIDGLRLDYAGVLREFPDLKGNENWRSLAIERFKEHIKTLPTELERACYIEEDLKKYGYKPFMRQRAGFRPERIY